MEDECCASGARVFSLFYFSSVFQLHPGQIFFFETECCPWKFKFRQRNDDVAIRYNSAKTKLALDIQGDMSQRKKGLSWMPGGNSKNKQLHNLLCNHSWQNPTFYMVSINMALRLETSTFAEALASVNVCVCLQDYVAISFSQMCRCADRSVCVCVYPYTVNVCLAALTWNESNMYWQSIILCDLFNFLDTTAPHDLPPFPALQCGSHSFPSQVTLCDVLSPTSLVVGDIDALSAS